MRLLLCEDERDLAAAVKKILEINKYTVDVAYDGIQALEKAHTYRYELIILDVMMPRMDGFQVLKLLRGEGDETPVLMLTARAEIDDKVLGLDIGADDYMTKPFQIKELLARIRALTRRSSSPAIALTVGNLTLDPNTYELRAKASARLTRTEYQLMEFLIRNKDKLVSTERIMEAVWDYDSEAEINVVWAYISALRKKLVAIGADVTINAVRGLGYQLGAKK
ncbi:MAG: response regulator transcription factor [Erysipelotrichaceae bacterium]|nr:response regulator transcription factor [Erysipelotrichaceae bacterium]